MTADLAQKPQTDDPVNTIAAMAIEFDVAADEGLLATPEAILSKTREHVLPTLEQVLADPALEGAVAQIDVLEIDLGKWPADPVWSDLRRVFAEKLLAALGPYLTWPQAAAAPVSDDLENDEPADPAGFGPEDPVLVGSAPDTADPRAETAALSASLFAFLAHVRGVMHREPDPARRDALARGSRILAKVQVSDRAPGITPDQHIKLLLGSLDRDAQAVLGSLLMPAGRPSDANSGMPPKTDRGLRHNRGTGMTLAQSTANGASDQPAVTTPELVDGISGYLSVIATRAAALETPLERLMINSGMSPQSAGERARLIAPHIMMRATMAAQDNTTAPPYASDEVALEIDQQQTGVSIAGLVERSRSQVSKDRTDGPLGSPKPSSERIGEYIHLWLPLLMAAGHSRNETLATLADIYGLKQRDVWDIAGAVVDEARGTGGAQTSGRGDPSLDEARRRDEKPDRGLRGASVPRALVGLENSDIRSVPDAPPPEQSSLDHRADKTASHWNARAGTADQLGDARPRARGHGAPDQPTPAAIGQRRDVSEGQKKATGGVLHSDQMATHPELDSSLKAGPQSGKMSDQAANNSAEHPERGARSAKRAVTSTILSVVDGLDVDNGMHWRVIFDMIWRALPAAVPDGRDVTMGHREHVAQSPLPPDNGAPDNTNPPPRRQSSTVFLAEPTPAEPRAFSTNVKTTVQEAEPSAPSEPGTQTPLDNSLSRQTTSSSRVGSPAHMESSTGAVPGSRSPKAGSQSSHNDLQEPTAETGRASVSSTRLAAETGQPSEKVAMSPDASPKQPVDGIKAVTVGDDMPNSYLEAVMALAMAPRGPDDQFEDWLEEQMIDLMPDARARRFALRHVAARLSYGAGGSAPVLRRLALAAVENVLSRSRHTPPMPSVEDTRANDTGANDTGADVHPNDPEQSYLSERGGLVLFHAYLPMLFDRLRLLDAKRQISKENIPTARRALQLIADALSPEDQPPDPVEKLLLGLPQNGALPSTPDLVQPDLALINSLLVSVIEQWGALGQTSPDGLRDAFIRRNAVLRQQEMSWLLHVDAGPFDVLLDRLPWSFSTIALPWMPEPCIVHWRDNDA